VGEIYMQKSLKDDVISGFIVFLIALPLSIGIALAAGAPASAGILSAIIGGIIGTLFTGAHIAINGPAAGLIVVISSSILSLGGGDLALGFKRTLAATVIAGLLQIALGVFRLGRVTFLCPTSVVHGMLAAIGTIIMIKQIPVLLGVSAKSGSVVGIVAELPQLIQAADWPVLLIGLLCIVVLITWNYLPKKISSILPGPLIAVSIGLGLSYFFDFEHPHNVNWLSFKHHIGPEFLVHVPESIKELFIFPSFDIIFTFKSLISIGTIFIVGSLESLLSSYAVDKLDPYKRKSNLDKDIIGKGISNICCGFLGAYPIITEIVRSSANIANGAKTKWANFYHGIFILLFVGLLPGLINHIPLTALAAVLLLVGFNLAHPRHFLEVWHHGKDQFILFTLTLVITLVEDLLVGIAVGIITKIVMHLIRGVKVSEFFNPIINVSSHDNEHRIELQSNIVFLGYLKLQKVIENAKSASKIIVIKNDFYTDHTISELIKENTNSQEVDSGMEEVKIETKATGS
jgi:MFS superfamily sulfate permease-like transporter